jgi:hypothetical protein
MTWTRIDDGFWAHPRTITTLERGRDGLASLGLWATLLSWCGAFLTDGRIPRSQPRRLAGATAERLAAILVEDGWWEPTDDGWQVHDYLAWNPSRTAVEEARAIRKLGGDARAGMPGARGPDGRFKPPSQQPAGPPCWTACWTRWTSWTTSSARRDREVTQSSG